MTRLLGEVSTTRQVVVRAERSAAAGQERLQSLNLKCIQTRAYAGYIWYMLGNLERNTSDPQTEKRPKRKKRESRGARPDLSPQA